MWGWNTLNARMTNSNEHRITYWVLDSSWKEQLSSHIKNHICVTLSYRLRHSSGPCFSHLWNTTIPTSVIHVVILPLHSPNGWGRQPLSQLFNLSAKEAPFACFQRAAVPWDPWSTPPCSTAPTQNTKQEALKPLKTHSGWTLGSPSIHTQSREKYTLLKCLLWHILTAKHFLLFDTVPTNEGDTANSNHKEFWFVLFF